MAVGEPTQGRKHAIAARRVTGKLARHALGLLLLCTSLLTVTKVRADGFAPEPSSGREKTQRARTLLLALDGVPFRVAERARSQGAFKGWSHTSRVVSTFPSTTHVAFTSLLEPFGVAPADGYELRYFSRDKNEMVGGSPFNFQKQAHAWVEVFDIKRRTFRQKFVLYAFPKSTSRREVRKVRKAVLKSSQEVVLAHIASTDALQHLRGDKATLNFLLYLDGELKKLKQRHLEMHGRPLRIVLYSDHGNVDKKVRSTKGIRRLLRDSGFNVTKHLNGPDDVVAPTFGIVSYGALFTNPERAQDAARAVVLHEGVDLAAWISGPQEIDVLSSEGRGRIRWRQAGQGHRLAYETIEGDPLLHIPARSRLHAAGLLDSSGFTWRREWLRETARDEYPDSLGRLVEALAGDRIRSKATVLLSLRPGYGWGWMTAHRLSRLHSGRLEGTHGGLDSESTLGFMISDDTTLRVPFVQRADRALAIFAPDQTPIAAAKTSSSAAASD